MNTIVTNYLGGAIILGFCIIALFFLKFWRRTRDPFFQAFALAFLIMGIGRVAEAISRTAHADTPNIYLFRLLSFSIIIYAIIRKNISGKK